MSDLLWKYFWDNDVERFRRLLVPSTENNHGRSSMGLGMGSPFGSTTPSGFGSPSRATLGSKSLRRTPVSGSLPGGGRGSCGASMSLLRLDINTRDHAGLTLLLRVASSTLDSAVEFAQALLDNPATDISVQDMESGWNALHRALYAGNLSIARMLLARERKELQGSAEGSFSALRLQSLIKTKDHEGNSPFDVFNQTMKDIPITIAPGSASDTDSDARDTDFIVDELLRDLRLGSGGIEAGEEVFVFGSNKNCSLGTGDEDDRQFPERIQLRRPKGLAHELWHRRKPAPEFAADNDPSDMSDASKTPFVICTLPILVKDVVMAKFHTAVVTTDPVSNLYMTGIGRGGRLGLGDENTRFRYVPVGGPLCGKCVSQVALGQDHTMAVVDSGELWTWGLNANAQLGYSLPPPPRLEDSPFSTVPRQVSGPLKKESVRGVAASRHHSVAHTGSSLYCWGRNVGQLGLVDLDARSLQVQPVPRKVSTAMFSAPILMVSAIDKATTCLLENHQVCVFTNNGYTFVKFEELLSQVQIKYSSRYDPTHNKVKFVTSGGETIAAVTNGGDLCTVTLRGRNTPVIRPAGSTTNPGKIKSAITNPLRVWASKKDGVHSASVGEDGSVIISTHSGAVWIRIKRSTAKSAAAGMAPRAKAKDFKFQRVPHITDVVRVTSSIFGAFAAIRRDSDIMKNNVIIGKQTLWQDVAKLLPIRDCIFSTASPPSDNVDNSNKARRLNDGLLPDKWASSPDVEDSLKIHIKRLQPPTSEELIYLCTSLEPDVRLPVHRWIIGARSPVLRAALATNSLSGSDYDMPDTFRVETASSIGGQRVVFLGLDFLALLNMVVYSYTDTTLSTWDDGCPASLMEFRYRQVRIETMSLASRLVIPGLEASARQLTSPLRFINQDFSSALHDAAFFDTADLLVELADGQLPLHSSLACRRCPFFDGLLHGRSGGLWISHRRTDSQPVRVDFRHVRVLVFGFVRRFLYVDEGPEMFARVVSENLDDFFDIVMEVLSIANELMLDRLSDICQHVMAGFVNSRNVADLLNEIGPCYVSKFKQAALQYICTQGEMMLENHLLDGLDGDLLAELDQTARQNQLRCSSFVRSGRADIHLHSLYPDLATDLIEERQRRVRDMAFRSRNKDTERNLAYSLKSRVGSPKESSPLVSAAAVTSERDTILLKSTRDERADNHASPILRSGNSRGECVFSMDEEIHPHITQTTNQKLVTAAHSASVDNGHSLQRSLADPVREVAADSPQEPKKPWKPTALSTSRAGLRDIISEATARNIDMAVQRVGEPVSKQPLPNVRLSQRERKQKQHQLRSQQIVQVTPDAAKGAWELLPSKLSQKPAWDTNFMPSASNPIAGIRSGASRSVDVINDTLPKEVAPPSSSPSHIRPGRRTGSSDTKFSGHKTIPAQPPATINPPPFVPHSKQYISRPPKRDLQEGWSTMSDIIRQQKTEQDTARAAATAKHSLDDIQQEQEFLEWWEREEKRTREQEALKAAEQESKHHRNSRGSRQRGVAGRGKMQGHGENSSPGRGSSPSGSARTTLIPSKRDELHPSTNHPRRPRVTHNMRASRPPLGVKQASDLDHRDQRETSGRG